MSIRIKERVVLERGDGWFAYLETLPDEGKDRVVTLYPDDLELLACTLKTMAQQLRSLEREAGQEIQLLDRLAKQGL